MVTKDPRSTPQTVHLRRLYFLHQLQQRKRKSHSRQSSLVFIFLLAISRKANHHQRYCWKSPCQYLRRLFWVSPFGQSVRGNSIATKRSNPFKRIPRRAFTSIRKRVWRQRSTSSSLLGRFFSPSSEHWVLARTPQPPPRPPALHPHQRLRLEIRTLSTVMKRCNIFCKVFTIYLFIY